MLPQIADPRPAVVRGAQRQADDYNTAPRERVPLRLTWSAGSVLAVARRRRALPHNLLAFVDLETGQLQVLDHPLGELLARVIGHVFLEQPAQEIAATADSEADREGELVAEGAVIHGDMFWLCSHQ